MLRYIALGDRQYWEKPIKVYARPYWEFQAVLQGRIAEVLPIGAKVLKSRTLWIFPARSPHGWSGERGKCAEVSVFHFVSVPEPIRRLANELGRLEIPIDARVCARLRELARQADRYWRHPGPGMTLCYEHVLLELSLLALEAHPQSKSTEGNDRDRDRVEQALAWFAEHLKENPDQRQVARSIGSSPAHLRRMFHEVLQTPPKPMFDQLRFQRAMQLMADPEMKLETVGESCGFGSASAFSRAFKNKFGCSPETWRG